MAKLSLVDAEQIYPERKIYLDYLGGVEKLGPFYKYYPANERALGGRVEELAAELKGSAKLSDALFEYNQQVGPGQGRWKTPGCWARAKRWRWLPVNRRALRVVRCTMCTKPSQP